jgi:hypothetical protein
MVLAWPKILVPFFGWAGELRNPQTIKGDNIAGITVALVLFPQSMDHVRLAGLPPLYRPVCVLPASHGGHHDRALSPAGHGNRRGGFLDDRRGPGALVNDLGLRPDERMVVYLGRAALCIARAKKQLLDVFERTGFAEHLGANHRFRSRTEAVLAARAVPGAEDWDCEVLGPRLGVAV